MTTFEFEITYSEPQVRRAVRAFYGFILKRELDWKLYLALGLVITGLILRSRGDRIGWFEWSLCGVLVSGTLFFFMMYRVHLQQSLERLYQMQTRIVRFHAQDDSLTVASDLGSSTVPWSTFTSMLDRPDCLILGVRKTAMIMIPKPEVDTAALDFIRTRVAGHRHTVQQPH
ncbi:MAG TPA: YcxB family protein [Candidatus Competibacteraceae bacterium]|nr:YcxB family protein [Candidatus Competibacteraceae bacterium]